MSDQLRGPQQACSPPSTDWANPESQLCPEASLSPNSLQDGKEYLFQAKDEVSCPLSAHTPVSPLPFSGPSNCRFSFLPSLLSFPLSVAFFGIRQPTGCHLDVCEGHTNTRSLS